MNIIIKTTDAFFLLKNYISCDVNFSLSRLGNALHSFSFAAVPYKGSFCNIPEPGKLQASMSASWQFFNYVSGDGPATTTEPIVVRNPVSIDQA